MAINTRDFGDSNIVAERIIRDIMERKAQQKWWNKIIPKADEGQVIPNGISYKTFGNNFYIMLRIYNFRARLGFKYYNLDWDMEADRAIKKTSLGLTLNLNYN